MKLFNIILVGVLFLSTNGLAQNASAEFPIKTMVLVHHSHTDLGYTDNPIIINDLQKRYIDIALDAIIETADRPEGERFCWTAEAIEPVYAWWQEASPARRKQFLKAISDKQLDVNALPFSIMPYTNSRQNKVMTNWIPEDLWGQLKPTYGLMNDVNGFPMGIASDLLDKGINHIWLSINTDWGGTPFKQPYALWWKMPDGRKTLVWLNLPYWEGYNIFNKRHWVYGWEQAHNPQFRMPREGDMMLSDEKSVREANRICVEKLQKMVDEGYSYDFIALSITNQWRIDNDGPMLHLLDFVKKWNELGLKPTLQFTTVSSAMDIIEKKLGNQINTYEGAFTDWWTFGGPSAPREMAAARMANVYIQALQSPIFGSVNDVIKRNIYEIDKDLCLFAEHTFAANQAILRPFEPLNQGSIAEKNIFAYRPYEKAKWMLAQRTRNIITNEPEGLYIVNTSETPYSGWVRLYVTAFRDQSYKSVVNTETQKKTPLIIEGEFAKYWVEQLPANSVKRFMLSIDSVPADVSIYTPDIKTDNNGWPISAQWKEMDKPLFEGEIVGLSSLESTVGRDLQGILWAETNNEIRAKKVKASMKETWATVAGKASVKETAYSLIYEQKFTHPRLRWATRTMEIYKNEPRAQVTVKFDRLSSANPEIFYLEFDLPKTDAFPVISNGGFDFEPYKGQIPGTCADQFAIDGWVNYASTSGNWLWATRDMPIISFGSQQFAVKSTTPPADMNKIFAMVYNNLWHLNYQDNVNGEMEFQFDMVWKNKIKNSTEINKIVQTINMPPMIMINPAARENKIVTKRMNEIK